MTKNFNALFVSALLTGALAVLSLMSADSIGYTYVGVFDMFDVWMTLASVQLAFTGVCGLLMLREVLRHPER